MKVIHISNSDLSGGAARAAYRIHSAMSKGKIESEMWVNHAYSGDETVVVPGSKIDRLKTAITSRVSSFAARKLTFSEPGFHSLNLIGSNLVKKINQSDADVINLHWINDEMLSVRDIGRISKPVVWTLHDMWAFTGSDHYTNHRYWKHTSIVRTRQHSPISEWLPKAILKHKERNWKSPICIVCPSNWLLQCVRESRLMQCWPVSQVMYPIDTSIWCPVEKIVAREILGLPSSGKVILFGAATGTSDPRKGFDLLKSSLSALRYNHSEVTLAVFGQKEPKIKLDLGYHVHYLGKINDDISLKVMYSAADVFALPSRLDNLPLTCIEAMSCGTPVVAYNSSGPPTMISHMQNGYLSEAYNTRAFAHGLEHFLDRSEDPSVNASVRATAQELFSEQKIAFEYKKIYEKVLRNDF